MVGAVVADTLEDSVEAEDIVVIELQQQTSVVPQGIERISLSGDEVIEVVALDLIIEHIVLNP